jgi:hypothetical protein
MREINTLKMIGKEIVKEIVKEFGIVIIILVAAITAFSIFISHCQ